MAPWEFSSWFPSEKSLKVNTKDKLEFRYLFREEKNSENNLKNQKLHLFYDVVFFDHFNLRCYINIVF